MHKILVITVMVSFCFTLCACNVNNRTAMRSANSAKLQKLQKQYSAKKEDLSKQAQNKSYTYENDVLKIDMK